MSQTFRTFSINPANQAGTMTVKQVVSGTIENTLPEAPTAMTVATSGGVFRFSCLLNRLPMAGYFVSQPAARPIDAN